MSMDGKSYVQIASNHLSLEDVELLTKGRQQTSNKGEAIVESEAQPRASNIPKVSVPLVRNVERTTKSTRLHRQVNRPVTTIPFMGETNYSFTANSGLDLVSNGLAEQMSPPKVHVDEASTPQSVNHSTSERLDQKRVFRIDPAADRIPLPKMEIETPSTLRMANVRADLPERPDDWLPNIDKEEKRSDKESANNIQGSDSPAFHDLAKHVIEKFPLGNAALILVTEVDQNCKGDTVGFQLAQHLASQNIGRVLLADSHFESRKLSKQFGLDRSYGLADIFTHGQTVGETICDTDVTNLDFLPVGSSPMCKKVTISSGELAHFARDLKNDYQFIVVSIGEVFHRASTMWARHCDATYLALELNATNRLLARSSVVRLQQYGARLAGCVCTDAA